MESCPRGRRCSTRNAVYVMYLGFESLTLRQSKKQVVRPAFAFAKQKRDSNKEGADLSAEENSPVDCFRRRGQGAKRREGIRQYAEKIPNSPPKREVMLWHCFSFLFRIRTRREQTCLRKKTFRWTVFADVVKERSDAKAYSTFLSPLSSRASPCNKGRLG